MENINPEEIIIIAEKRVSDSIGRILEKYDYDQLKEAYGFNKIKSHTNTLKTLKYVYLSVTVLMLFLALSILKFTNWRFDFIFSYSFPDWLVLFIFVFIPLIIWFYHASHYDTSYSYEKRQVQLKIFETIFNEDLFPNFHYIDRPKAGKGPPTADILSIIHKFTKYGNREFDLFKSETRKKVWVDHWLEGYVGKIKTACYKIRAGWEGRDLEGTITTHTDFEGYVMLVMFQNHFEKTLSLYSTKGEYDENIEELSSLIPEIIVKQLKTVAHKFNTKGLKQIIIHHNKMIIFMPSKAYGLFSINDEYASLEDFIACDDFREKYIGIILLEHIIEKINEKVVEKLTIDEVSRGPVEVNTPADPFELITESLYEGDDKKIYLIPEIPLKKLKEHIHTYGQGIKPEEVLVLLDLSVFHSAKEGIMITDSGFYFKTSNDDTGEGFRFDDLKHFERVDTSTENFLKFYVKDKEPIAFEKNDVVNRNQLELFLKAILARQRSRGYKPSPGKTEIKSIEDAVQVLKKDSARLYSSVYFFPEIPSKKLKNAIKSYGKNLDPRDVRVLVDTTFFGGAREGLMITDNEFFYKPISYDGIGFSFDEFERYVRIEGKEIRCYLTHIAEPVVIKDYQYINHHQLAVFFYNILEWKKANKVD